MKYKNTNFIKIIPLLLFLLIATTATVFSQKIYALSGQENAPTLIAPSETGEQPTVVSPAPGTNTAGGGQNPSVDNVSDTGSSASTGGSVTGTEATTGGGQAPATSVSQPSATSVETEKKPSIPALPTIVQPSSGISEVLPLEEVSFSDVLPLEEVSVSQKKIIHIQTTTAVAPLVQSAISSLEVKPAQVFSPVFSQVTNLVVNPVIEETKLVYHLELYADKPIYKENEPAQPIFDLGVDQPVEFKLADNKIIVNNEQVIDYKNIVRENEVMPPVELKIQSAVTDGKIHDLEVITGPESAEFKFIYKDKEAMMPVYSDFKVEEKKISLLGDNQIYDVTVLPPEVYSAIYSGIESDNKTVVKDLSLKIGEGKAIYDLSVNEPFKLFWFIPVKIDSQYIVDAGNGNIIKKHRPWWSFLGGKVAASWDGESLGIDKN
jgi:hypothetical protein